MAAVEDKKPANARSHKPLEPKKREPRALEIAPFLAGILLFMLGLGLLGNELNALIWRLRAKWSYVEGGARVEKTEIIPREGAFDLEITYHLEKDGRNYRGTARLERDGPTAAERE